jgi:hypothetical protein
VGADRPAELVAEHEIVVPVGVGGEVTLEELSLAVVRERLHGFGVERNRAPRPRRLRWSDGSGGEELLLD